MMGLAHRGFELPTTATTSSTRCASAGYWSGLIGEQHLSADPDVLGYDQVVEIDSNHVGDVAPAAVELIAQAPPEPFFLSVGFFETHREYFEPTSVRDALYSLPPANLPDTPETRRDMASYKASARSLDQGVGAVLNALDEHDLADDTLVILTTDHGLAVPGREGDAVRPRARRAADHARAGRLRTAGGCSTRSSPTSTCSRRSASSRASSRRTGCRAARCCRWCGARSRRSTTRSSPRSPTTPPTSRSGRCAPSAASTSAASATARRAGAPEHRRQPDQGPAARARLGRPRAAREELYDLRFDPDEAQPDRRAAARRRRRRAARAPRRRWMRETEDPLLDGPVPRRRAPG